MKLYTEEQMAKVWMAGQKYWETSGASITFEELLEHEKPIELPSDVEVGKIVLGNSPIMEHRDSGYFAAGAMKYNKWMKEQILNQNK